MCMFYSFQRRFLQCRFITGSLGLHRQKRDLLQIFNFTGLLELVNRLKITWQFYQISTTHVKISQLVASLQTSRQQIVFARLVTSSQQIWNKLLTTCNNLVDIVRLVARLFQQGCYNHDITILLQPCVVNLVKFLLYHDCIRLVRTTL